MRPHGHKPFHIFLLLGLAFVSVAYESATSANRTVEASSQTEKGPGPIPPDAPLARPESLQQIGVPVEATRAAAPADNPRRRRRSHWAKSSSSTGACQWMGRLPAVRATIRHALSPTEDRFPSASTAKRASAILRRY